MESETFPRKQRLQCLLGPTEQKTAFADDPFDLTIASGNRLQIIQFSTDRVCDR